MGLSWAAVHPDRLERLFILTSTLTPSSFKVPIPIALRAFRAPVNER
jgi:hypothetical protein